MRKIKFRAWHTRFNKMFTADEMADDQMCMLPNGYFINVASIPRLSQVDYDRIMIPLQFTGLLDKNGKEIYEGDIVMAWFPGMPNDFRVRQEITFIDGCFGCGNYPLKVVDKTTLELIGNIYENPELLKD